MVDQCPKCANPLRPGAKFCPRCGNTLAAQSAAPPAPYVPPVAYVAGQAAATAMPVMKAAGDAAWQASKKGMGWFARIVTLGGRAAFSEITHPRAVAEGRIDGRPVENKIPAPNEAAAWLFALSFVLLPFFFIGRTDWTPLAVLGGLAFALLILNFIGLRRPVFSRLTFGGLFGRYSHGMVPELRLQVNDVKRGSITVRLIGSRRENVQLAIGQLVRLYGVQEGKGVRAWKIDVYGADGQPLGIITAPRTLPLFAMLFAPLIVWFIIWVLTLIF